MHTLKLETSGGRPVYINHNSDWSGDVRIDGGYRVREDYIEIDGKLLFELAKAAAIDVVRSTVEDALEKL
jgi:hypothetical protein